MSTLQTTTSTGKSSLSPNPGDTYFETDTKNIIVYDGSNWRGYQYDQAAIPAISNSYNLSFDGTGDIVNVGNISSLLSTTTNSVSIWFKLDSSTATDPYHLFGLDNGSASSRGIMILKTYDSGNAKHNIDFSVYDDDSGSSYLYQSIRCEITPDTTWHHVVATHYIDPANASNNRLKVYYDGQELTPYSSPSNGTLNALAKPALNYSIGARNTTSPARVLVGDIDEVAFWNVELDSDNAIQLYNSFGGEKPFDLSSDSGDYNQSANLQGWWRFEEGSGSTASDETGNSDGTISAAQFVSNTL